MPNQILRVGAAAYPSLSRPVLYIPSGSISISAESLSKTWLTGTSLILCLFFPESSRRECILASLLDIKHAEGMAYQRISDVLRKGSEPSACWHLAELVGDDSGVKVVWQDQEVEVFSKKNPLNGDLVEVDIEEILRTCNSSDSVKFYKQFPKQATIVQMVGSAWLFGSGNAVVDWILPNGCIDTALIPRAALKVLSRPQKAF